MGTGDQASQNKRVEEGEESIIKYSRVMTRPALTTIAVRQGLQVGGTLGQGRCVGGMEIRGSMDLLTRPCGGGKGIEPLSCSRESNQANTQGHMDKEAVRVVIYISFKDRPCPGP